MHLDYILPITITRAFTRQSWQIFTFLTLTGPGLNPVFGLFFEHLFTFKSIKKKIKNNGNEVGIDHFWKRAFCVEKLSTVFWGKMIESRFPLKNCRNYHNWNLATSINQKKVKEKVKHLSSRTCWLIEFWSYFYKNIVVMKVPLN